MALTTKQIISLVAPVLSVIVASILSYLFGRQQGKLDRYRDRDRKLYARIQELLPKEPMEYYREHDFSGSFKDVVFETLAHFAWECEYPQGYFLDGTLERLKLRLLEASQAFYRRLSDVTVEVSNRNAEAHRLPPRDQLGAELHYALSAELNALATAFYTAYREFVIAAERRLA